MDSCDVCNSPAQYACSNCLDAVYCSPLCQQRDHSEHQMDCIHPSKMEDDHLMDEIRMHLEHIDEDHDAEAVKVGQRLIGLGVATPAAREWLISFLDAGIKRRFNRQRVRHQRRATRPKIRKSRREGRDARKGTRQANALGREKKRLGKTELRTQKNKTQETTSTRRNL